ncbi:MAG: hypothetical protein ABUL66_03800 [Verrucomicrobiota bacterium]
MFDLEKSISVWRKQMLAAGIKPSALEELESHLREEIEREMKLGLSLNVQEAFNFAIQKIGQGNALKSEFTKVGETLCERLKRLVCTLAGISNYQLATNMNTPNQNIEPRRTTYAKVGTFLFPAVFLWLITVVYVLPKAAEICQAAGTTIFNFAQPVPVIIRAWAVIGQAMIFLTNHVFLIGGAIVLTFVLLERYFSQWPRYRRAVIGAGAFILNAAVLLSLTIMIVSILVAAPALTHHLK